MPGSAKRLSAVIVLAILAALGWWRWGRPVVKPDDYDYAAAFERAAADSRAAVIDIPALAGKTRAQLQALLGAAEHCETSLYSSRCRYAPGNTEIVFIDGKADWITVNDLGETPFAAAALGRIGLGETPPDRRENSELIWNNLDGLREVRVVGDGEHVEFIRIKAKS